MTNTFVTYCEKELWIKHVKPFWQKHNTAKNWLWVFGSIFVSGAVLVIVNTLSIERKTRIFIDENRDYTLIPFDELDAMQVCEQETRARYGDELIRSTVDTHSTRLDPRSGDYKVFMFVDLGDLKHYQVATVHCFVDPRKFMIDHYRTIFDKKETLLDKAMNLFGFTGEDK